MEKVEKSNCIGGCTLPKRLANIMRFLKYLKVRKEKKKMWNPFSSRYEKYGTGRLTFGKEVSLLKVNCCTLKSAAWGS